VIGVFLLTCVGVGVFVFNRRTQNHPVRYVSAVTIRIAPTPPTSDDPRKTPTTTAPAVILSPAAKLALLPANKEAALTASNLAEGEAPRIGFNATVSRAADFLHLQVSAPTRVEAVSVAKNWANRFIVARKQDAARAVQQKQTALFHRTTGLHNELVEVDKHLAKLLPKQYGNALNFDQQFGQTNRESGGGDHGPPPPPIPETSKVSVYLINKAYERINLI
jgi:hypothetical protein